MAHAQDIIAQAIDTESKAFRAALIQQAEMHDNFMLTTRNEPAKRGAQTQFTACLAVYDWIGRDDLSPSDKALAIVTDGFSTALIALNVACKLLDIPAHTRTNAAIEFGEAHTI